MSGYSQWRADYASYIAEIAFERFPDMEIDIGGLTMDIEAADCHVGLNFWKLANANEGTFGHDVLGIRKHLNKGTARLEHFFKPRCTCAQRPKGLPEYPDWFIPASGEWEGSNE